MSFIHVSMYICWYMHTAYYVSNICISQTLSLFGKKILGWFECLFMQNSVCGCQVLTAVFWDEQLFVCFRALGYCKLWVQALLVCVCVRVRTWRFTPALCLPATFTADACLRPESHCSSSVEQISLFVKFSSLIWIISVCYSQTGSLLMVLWGRVSLYLFIVLHIKPLCLDFLLLPLKKKKQWLWLKSTAISWSSLTF